MDAWVEERLSDYLDGTLSPQERAQVEAHLKSSERARASLDALRWTVQLLRETPAPPLPRQFTLPVTPRAPARSVPAWMAWSLRGVAVAATAAFVILLVGTLMRQTPASNVAMMEQAPAAAPSIAIAMGPTPIPTFPPPAPMQDNAAGSSIAATPIMVTVAAPAPTTETIPVTVIPSAAKAQPTQAAKQSSNTAPLAPTQQPKASAPTAAAPAQKAQPTQTTANAAAAAQGAPELAPATATQVTDTQRTFGIQSIQGRVTAPALQVRQGPGTKYRGIAVLKRGDSVQAIGRAENSAWLVIQFDENGTAREGWVAARFIELQAAPDVLPIVDAPQDNAPTVPTETPALTETSAPASDGATATPEPTRPPSSVATPEG